jgi:hypothetical protein
MAAQALGVSEGTLKARSLVAEPNECDDFTRLQADVEPEPRSLMPRKSRAYGEANALSSSRAASLKSFSGSIPAPLFTSSRSSRIVLFGVK